MLIIPPILAFEPPNDPTAEPEALQGRSFYIRAGAYAIDLAIINAGSYAISPWINQQLPGLLRMVTQIFHLGFQFGAASKIVQYACSAILIVMYMVLFEWIFGSSPGKIILGLRVVQEDGSRCRLWSALVRGLFRLIDGWFFGYIAAQTMKPPLYQRYGDKAAKTIVVSKIDLPIGRRLLSWQLLAAILVYPILLTTITLGSLAIRVTQVQHLIIAQANRINLQKKDLDGPFSLRTEGGREAFTSKTNWDANQRVFDSDLLVVKSQVILMDAYPSDSDADLMKFMASSLQKEFKGDELKIDPPAQIGVGERGWVARYTDSTTQMEGFEILFYRQNAFVRLIFYGSPGVIRANKAVSLADLIDMRIFTGVYPPLERGPLF